MQKSYTHSEHKLGFQISCYENGSHLRDVCVVYKEEDAKDLVNIYNISQQKELVLN